jgi:hypothetical protein
MLIVHEKKKRSGTMAVAWTWLPFFIAADSALIESVDAKMKEMFMGKEFLATSPSEDALMLTMHDAVIDMVCEKYPFSGLRKYLEAICEVDPSANDGLEP